MEAREYYNNIIENKTRDLNILNSSISKLAIIRLGIVLAGIVSAYLLYKKNNFIFLIIASLIYISIFIIVAYIQNKKIIKKTECKSYIELNNIGLKRLDGTWRDFKDIGEEFLDEKHGFINDLDIFGSNSLFQWINSTKTKFGRMALANILKLDTLPNHKEVRDRQEAIKELADKIEWRQKLAIKATTKKAYKDDIDQLLKWADETYKIGLIMKISPYLFIALTMIVALLVVFKILPISYLILVFMVNYLVVKTLTKNLSNVVNLFHHHKNDIEAYSNILSLIQNENFSSKLLLTLKERLNNNENRSCNEEMKALKNLVDWIGDSSSNAYYLIFNVTILSDIFILKNLEKWRNINGKYLREWLEVMGEFEALASISNIAFDFREWKFPEVNESSTIEGTMIGHPMLAERAITNSFSLDRNEKVALITGSNMSGKSTFLRTVGLNLILSYIGSVTYSKNFKCGIFNIYTCMRTKDNLEENISSFYAEILRIKLLISSAKRGEKVFFLLDEIFKGTNSIDRHQGAIVLINQLVEGGGRGLVSTHDLELCELEKEKDWIVNYNFQEYYEKNSIKFDYKLRIGRSVTRNAIHLMKLAGIDFKDI